MRQIGFLAVVFAVLLVAVIVKETSRPERGNLRDQVPLVPVATEAFTPADVAAVDVTGKDGSPLFRIERSGQRWLVSGAFRAPAAAGRVLELAQAAAAARGEMRLDDGAKLSKFHLADGEAPTVRITGESGQVLAHFSVGKTSGTNGCFVRLRHDPAEADRSYSVSADLRGALGLARSRPGSKPSDDPEAEHFHDKNLPSLKVAEATQLTMTTPLWRLVLQREGEGDTWTVAEGGPGVPLDLEAVGRLVRQMRSGAAASELVDPARRGELGLDQPTYTLTATLPDGEERTLLGAADHETQTFFARLDVDQDPDVVYEIAGHQWNLMFPPGSGLFEFPRLSPEESERGVIDIDSAEGSLRMVRNRDHSWTLVEPDWGLRPNQSKLRSIAGLLPNLQPSDWLDSALAPAGIGEPQITIAYGPLGPRGATQDPSTKIVISGKTPTGNNRVAQLPNMPGRLVVLADSTVDRIAPPLFDLFEKTLLADWDDPDIERLEVRPLTDSGTAFEVVRGDDGWTVRSDGAETPGDGVAVDDWVATLTSALVTGVEAAPGAPSHVIVVHGATEDAASDTVALGVLEDGDAGYVVFTGALGDGGFEVVQAFRVAEGDLLPAAGSLQRTDEEE